MRIVLFFEVPGQFVEFILTPERSEIQNEDYVKCRNMYYHYVTVKI